jgi:hypothetical protein
VPFAVPKSHVHGNAPNASGESNTIARSRRCGSCTAAAIFTHDLLFGISIWMTNGAR